MISTASDSLILTVNNPVTGNELSCCISGWSSEDSYGKRVLYGISRGGNAIGRFLKDAHSPQIATIIKSGLPVFGGYLSRNVNGEFEFISFPA